MFFALISLSQAATLKVGPAEVYKTINSAVAASSAGDVVSVGPGTYVEDLDLRGYSISVVGAEGPYVTTISTGIPIELSAGTFEGFTISPSVSRPLPASTRGEPVAGRRSTSQGVAPDA